VARSEKDGRSRGTSLRFDAGSSATERRLHRRAGKAGVKFGVFIPVHHRAEDTASCEEIDRRGPRSGRRLRTDAVPANLLARRPRLGSIERENRQSRRRRRRPLEEKRRSNLFVSTAQNLSPRARDAPRIRRKATITGNGSFPRNTTPDVPRIYRLPQPWTRTGQKKKKKTISGTITKQARPASVISGYLSVDNFSFITMTIPLRDLPPTSTLSGTWMEFVKGSIILAGLSLEFYSA